MPRPLIGVNVDAQKPKSDPHGRRFYFIKDQYIDALHSAEADVIILPPHDTEESAVKLLRLVDGMLFIGGDDLDPRRDGWQKHETTKLMDARRESWDRRLMRLCGELRKPLFGIGVGMQLMAVTFGGNLMLHIPIDRPKALRHWEPDDPEHRHAVDIAHGGFFDRVFQDLEVKVNSSHHMAVDQIPPGFRVGAKAPDGIIEALESEQSDWIAFGTQFHPECGTVGSVIQLQLFKEFVDQIKAEDESLRATTRVVRGANNRLAV